MSTENLQHMMPPPTEDFRPFDPPHAPRAYRSMQPHQPNRADTQDEKRNELDAGLSDLLSHLLHQHSSVLALEAKLEQKQRDVEFREKKIHQLEVFLAEGQKQLYFQLDRDGVRHMTDVEVERVQRAAELGAKKQIADVEGEIRAQVERLRMRESAQSLREKQYRAVVGASMEREMRVALVHELEARIATREFERGFAAGREDGGQAGGESGVASREKAFLEGYAACRRVQVALTRLRSGQLAVNSPELEFLHNVDHAENLVERGVQLGRMEAADRVEEGREGLQRSGELTKGYVLCVVFLGFVWSLMCCSRSLPLPLQQHSSMRRHTAGPTHGYTFRPYLFS